ncbi:MAG: hypothetical protein HS116_18465 [Planctomycetes bacterium]|nr:hypothetical protein [Planctomycetota bacterium]
MTLPWWGWGIAAVLVGGGMVWSLIARLKRAEADAIENASLQEMQKSEQAARAAEAEIGAAVKAETEKTGPVQPNEWEF